MPARNLIVNDVDFGTLGFAVERCGDHRGTAQRQWPSRQVPGRYGEIVLNNAPTYRGRQLRISGWIDADSLSDAYSKLSELKYRLSNGITQIQYVDDETRYYFGYLVGGAVTGLDPQLTSTYWRTNFDIWCPDARAWGAESTVACSTSGTDVPMGDAPLRPLLTVAGALSGATVTVDYRSSTGGTLETFTVTGVTVGGGETLTIDCENQTVTSTTGGNFISGWQSTIGNFITLDPHDGDMPNSSWPQIKSGTAGKTVSVIYRKAYW